VTDRIRAGPEDSREGSGKCKLGWPSFAVGRRAKAQNEGSLDSGQTWELSRESLKPAAGKGRHEAEGIHVALDTLLTHERKQDFAPLVLDVKARQLEEDPLPPRNNLLGVDGGNYITDGVACHGFCCGGMGEAWASLPNPSRP